VTSTNYEAPQYAISEDSCLLRTSLNEPYGSTKADEFLDQLLKEDSGPWGWLCKPDE
jgi:hypothetical protein